MKKVSLLILVSLVLIVLASCQVLPKPVKDALGIHEHEWTDATCESPKTCECGATEGEALGHKWTEATCTAPKTCSVCQATEGEALGHDYTKANCTDPATCKNCGATTGKALGHSWLDATCTDPKTCEDCGAIEGEALGHTPAAAVRENEVAPGCETDGKYDSVIYCSACKAEISREKDVVDPATGHKAGTPVKQNEKAPTCTVAGSYDEVTYCTVEGCGAEVSRKTVTVEATGHKPGEAVHENGTEPDCINGGAYEEVYYCTVEGCGAEISREYKTVDALGHKMAPATCIALSTCTVCGHTEGEYADHTPAAEVKENEVAPKCEQNGSYDIVVYCSVEGCGHEISRKTVTVDATGHNMVDATCQAPKHCANNCGLEEGEKTNHKLEATYGANVSYACPMCNTTYTMTAGTLSDGTQHNAMSFGDNGVKGYGDDKAAIVDGHYELVLKETVDYLNSKDGGTAEQNAIGQHQIWVPASSGTGLAGLTSDNNAIGVLSFNMNIKGDNPDMPFRVQLVDYSSDATRWSEEWCISDYVFKLEPITSAEQTTVNVYGWGTKQIGTLTLTEDQWTGWVNVAMVIIPRGDDLTIHYYINNEYWESITLPLTTKTKGINSVYFTGSTITKGTGFKYDNIAFGCVQNAEWTLDVHTHTWIDADCEHAKRCYICGVTEGDPLGHTEATKDENFVYPDCVNTGSHEHVTYCSVCNKELKRETVTDAALGHIEQTVTGTPATCLEGGMTDGKICTREGCKTPTLEAQKPIPATGHKDENADKICDVCSADLNCKHEGERTPVDAVPPTCTATGLTAGEKCAICGEFTVPQTEVAAAGHKPGEEQRENAVAPTCTADGKYDSVYYCTVCGEMTSETKDVVDPKLGHNEVAHAGQAATCTDKGWKDYVTCSRCDYTTYEEIAALGHSFTTATCTAAKTCTVCGATEGTPDANAHTIAQTYQGGKLYYACQTCDYRFDVDTFDYLDGSSYNGMHVNADNNKIYYTANPDSDAQRYPVYVQDGDNTYYEYVRKTDAEGAANTTKAQLQLWLPTADGGTNKFSGFTAASHSIGYLSFKMNAYTDGNLEMQLVDHRSDFMDKNGDGVLMDWDWIQAHPTEGDFDNNGSITWDDRAKSPDYIRWGDEWAIKNPVFAVSTVTDGKAQLKGFGNVLKTIEVGADNYTGWFEITMQIVLDAESDMVIVYYYIDGAYAGTYKQPLSTHTNAIQGVYLNSNNTAAGTGYKIDNITFGYTAHKHDMTPEIKNGVLTYNCACGTNFVVSSEVREWNGDGNDSAFQHGPNGKWNTVYNEDGTWGFMFQPKEDADWEEYGAKGGQMQPWLPSSNRDANTLTGFSTENNAVGVISFDVKTSMTKVDGAGSTVTVGVGKPRNASDWNDGGSWTDDFFNVLAIMDNGADYTVKGGVNSGLLLATITKTDNGWSEWFNVMMVIDLDTDGTMTTYYYINGAFMASESRNLGVAAADGRYLNPQKIEAFQISGWTYAAETGMMFDNMYFGYTANGHNTLDGQRHVLTETTCGEKSTCICGWTGYTIEHTYEADCVAACSVCGIANEHVAPHTLVPNGATITCTKCNGYYTVDNSVSYDGAGESYEFYYAANGKMPMVNNNGVYEAIFNTEQAMPDISEVPLNDKGEPVAGSVIGDWAWNGKFGAQHMFWLPTSAKDGGLSGFSCANNSTGVLSFKMQTNVDSAFNISLAKARGDADWSGWSTSELKVLNVGGYSASGIVLKGGIGAGTNLVTIPVADGWSEWFQVDIMIQLKSDNTITLTYYINGQYINTFSGNMTIDSHDVRVVYINGWNFALNTGIKMDDIVFGCATQGIQYGAPFYKEVIAAEDVTNEILKAVATNKIKQWDQSSAHNNSNGTPVYVVADKNGEDVQALYFSKTTPWVGDEGEQFSEFRFNLDSSKKVVSFSFDYKIDGTVETGHRFTFTDFDGTTFYSDAYIQVKTPAKIEAAGDDYPELKGTDLVLDGEWHNMTYTFENPQALLNILFNLYHFQGELLVANLVVNYENPLYNADGTLKVTEIAAEDVTNDFLKAVATNKIKQWDQSSAHNNHNGTPEYVTLDKNGETVQALYMSKTTPWVGDEGEQFSEFRINLDSSKKVVSFSFDYIVNGTVETGHRFTFTDFDGTTFYSDAYIQVKTPTKIEAAGDDYPELKGTDLVLDGEWHNMTYTFENPQALLNILFNLYHFQGELVVANFVVNYAE